MISPKQTVLIMRALLRASDPRAGDGVDELRRDRGGRRSGGAATVA